MVVSTKAQCLRTKAATQSKKHCIWCKGTKHLHLKGRGTILCLNCKGSGVGFDGGDKVTGFDKPYMIGNEWGKRK